MVPAVILIFANYTSRAQMVDASKTISSGNSNSVAPRIALGSNGSIDIVWLDDRDGTPAVFFSHSSDGGYTFSAPLNVSNHPGSPAKSERIAADSAGNIYIVWSDDSSGAHTIFFSHSSDNGMTFSVPQIISQNSMGTDPAVAIDSSGGVDLLWIDKNDGERSIFFSRSADQGATFSIPLNLSNPGTAPRGPQLTTDDNGNAYVLWTQPNTSDKQTVIFSHNVITSLASFRLNPVTVHGGDSATATVTLSRPAPLGGATIALSSGDSSVASVPSTITVAEGVTNQTFAVGTSSVQKSAQADISASWAGETQIAKLDVLASPNAEETTNSVITTLSSTAFAAGVVAPGKTEDVVSTNNPANNSAPAVTGGRLSAYNLNNILYVDGKHFTTIEAAVGSLPKLNSKPAGIVWVTAPMVIGPGQEVTIGPYTQLRFSPGAIVTYTGSGVPFTCSDAPTSYGGDGGIYDLTLDGNPSAYAGIVNDECSWFHIEHTYVQNFTNGTGILYENTQRWTEQTTWIDVHSQNNRKSFDFQDNCSGHTGCPSFAYSRFYHVVATPMSNSDGFVLENDSNINNGDLELSCFFNNGSVCLRLMGSAEINPARVWIRGEFTRGSNATGIKTDVGTIWQPIGLMERWDKGTGSINDSIAGSANLYAWRADGYSVEQIFRQGPAWGASGNSFLDTLDVSRITDYRRLIAPDTSGTLAVSGASFHANSPLVCTDDNALLTTTGCGNFVENNTAILTGGSCSTPAHAFASCTSTVLLARPEPNTAYGASCTGIGPNGWPYIIGVTSKETTSITVQIGNGSGPAALSSSFKEIDCTITH